MTYIMTVTMTFANKESCKRFKEEVLNDWFNGPIWYDVTAEGEAEESK